MKKNKKKNSQTLVPFTLLAVWLRLLASFNFFSRLPSQTNPPLPPLCDP